MMSPLDKVNRFMAAEAPRVQVDIRTDDTRDEVILAFELPRFGLESRVALDRLDPEEAVAQTLKASIETLRREVSEAVGLEKRVDEIKANAAREVARAKLDALDEIKGKVGWMMNDPADRRRVEEYLEGLRAEWS